MVMAAGLGKRMRPLLVRATADLCGADFHLIADAGHIPCVEQPAATAKLLTDFLERTAR